MDFGPAAVLGEDLFRGRAGVVQEGVEQVAMHRGVVGPESEGVAVGGEGFIEAALVLEDAAEVGVSLGVGGAKANGLAEFIVGGVGQTAAVQGVAQVVMGVGEIRL